MEIFFGKPRIAWHHDGKEVDDFDFTGWGGTFSATTPILCDVNQDSYLDIAFGSDAERVYIYTSSAPYNPETIEWGMFHHDKYRTGNYNSPLINSPTNRSAISNTQPELIIRNAENFSYDVFTYTYSFYIYSDSGFNTVVDSITGVVEGSDTTSWTVFVPLQDDTRYYWRARPHNGDYYEHWMPIGEFFINKSNQPPGGFDLLSPVNNSTITRLKPRLEWSEPVDPDGDDILSYTIEYSTTPGFLSCRRIIDYDETEYRIKEELDEGQMYYWRVNVKDSSGAERLCNQTFSFFVKGNSLEHVKVYPNPAKQAEYVTIDSLDLGTEISIYTISGEKVYSALEDDSDGRYLWYLKNDHGKKVASGVYIIYLKNDYHERAIKFCNVR